MTWMIRPAQEEFGEDRPMVAYGPTPTRAVEVVTARQANVLRNGLLAITTAGDASPFADAYRAAGGGYEGLQAVAAEALRIADQVDESL